MSAQTRTSSFLDVADRLVLLLRDRLDDTVYVGWVNVSHGKRRSVEVAGLKDGLHQYPVVRAGRKPREETYALQVHLYAQASGPDPREASEAVLELLGALEDILADDVNLGLTDDYPTLRVGLGEWELDQSIADQRLGWRAHITADVDVATRLI